MKKISFIIIVLLFNLQSFSQSKIVEITGKIISEKDLSPIHYATIINIKKSKATPCDSLGFFHITMLSDDVLRINALGFERKYFSFKDSAINTSDIIVIKLKEKTYKISNVDIYEARWKDFEFEFIHTETEKQETKERIEKWFYTLIDPKELALLTASTAIGFPINYKTKVEKQKIKVEELEIQEIENKIIQSKYNPDLVAEITGLNEKETIRFMRFCMFDRKYLLETTEYDIIVEVMAKFDRYFKIIHR